jgi:hypothetical protein
MAQAGFEQIRKQVMISVPLSLIVQRKDKEVCLI